MIAKKYASVLMERKDKEYFYNRFSKLHELLSTNKDFADFLSSKIVKPKYKISFILNLFNENTKEFENLIYLLAENYRLSIVDKIFLQMQEYKMNSENISMAKIYTSSPIGVEVLKSLESDLSNKFGTNIKMSNIVTKSNNLKIVLESLGCEINISPDYLKHKIKEFILKAI